MPPYQQLKIELVEALGLSRDAFHIFIGFAVFLAFAAFSKKGLSTWMAIIPPLVLAILLELLDVRDALAYGYAPDPVDSLRDIFIAVICPALTVAFVRYRRTDLV